jgi:phenylpropionate dioxygenase-like ring-hydroxylating dioxygenase large terminal subunit
MAGEPQAPTVRHRSDWTGANQTDARAPVDAADLADSLQPFGESRMLPRAAYVDPAVFAWEQARFFGGGWCCAGFGSHLAEAGDQRAEQTGSASVLLVRGDDRKVRAFANTCRHRGHELRAAGASGHGNSIICPYHAWTYALDGKLRFGSGLSNRADFDPSGWGLIELPAEEWHGLIFVDSSGGAAAPLADALRELAVLVAPYEPERLVIAASRTYDAAANWKILTENYHECYHCPVIHPELCRISPPKSGRSYPPAAVWAAGSMDLRNGMATMSLDGASYGTPLRGLDAAALRTVTYVNIFPNVLLSLHPDYVMTHRLVPLAVDRTVIECTWAFAPEALQRPGFDPGYAVEFWDITNKQDWAACESVQRGLSSEHARPGPLSPDEDGVYQFVTMIARGYAGRPVWRRATVPG